MTPPLHPLVDRPHRVALLILVVAAAYAISGRLGLALAIPPGYATAIFPAAGVALGSVILFGSRVLPGVWLGSFVMNLWIGFDNGQPLDYSSVLIPVFIGTGALLQAAAGAALIRRFVAAMPELIREREILGFMLLGGPVACCVGATVGVATLWSFGALLTQSVLTNWFNWWLGDFIGVLLVTPLMLAFLARPRELWQRRRAALAVPMLITATLVVGAYLGVSHWEQRGIDTDFNHKAGKLVDALEVETARQIETLAWLDRFYNASNYVDRDEFRAFANPAVLMNPALRALEWVPRVPSSERAKFEAQQQRDGLVDFHIFEQQPNGEFSDVVARDEYFPVLYVEPWDANRRVAGFDLNSEPLRRAALLRARESGAPASTARIQLVQDAGTAAPWSVLIYFPNYRTSSGERSLYGVIVGALHVEDLVTAALSPTDLESFALQLEDTTAEPGAQLLYSRSEGRSSASAALVYERSFDMAGRQWRARFHATPVFYAQYTVWQAWGVLAAGLLFASLLEIYMLTVTGRTARVEQQVTERTAELQQSNQLLIAAKEQAERASKAKSEFLSSMSHELRTPLNAILGFAQLLSYSNALGPKQREHALNIQRGGEHLLRLINDVLDLSRIESGRMSLVLESVPVRDLLHECRTMLQPLADARRLRVSSDIENADAWVKADRTRLQQALMNLLSNAVKYNREGGEVELRCTTADGRVFFYVRDTGAGISAAQQASLFQSFNRLGQERSDIEGTGIGLVITRQLVEMMHGRVGLRSAEGAGTTFWIELPAATKPDREITAPATKSEADFSAAGHGRTVLYVEDNPSNLALVDALLKNFWGDLVLLSATSAEQGLELARQHRPDVILMDINLPGMDGYQAAAQLKDNAVTRDIPVIALTADAPSGGVQGAAEFAHYLTKPIDIPHFIRIMSEVFDALPRAA